MRILYLISQKPESTGSGFYVRALINQAVKSGHQCSLVAGISGSPVSDPLFSSLGHTGFVRFDSAELPFPIAGMSDVMPYDSTRFIDMNDSRLTAYRKAFQSVISDAVEKVKPDIIHTNHLWLMTALTRELFPDIPLVASCHGTDLRQMHNCPHLRKDIISSCRKADEIIALSQIQKKEISEMLSVKGDSISVAGSGFNNEMFYPGKKPETPPSRLLFAGKLSEAKGVPWLLEAIGRLRSPLPFHLYLAGSGSGSDYEKCLSLGKNVKDRVSFCGSLPQKKLAELMRQCHIFILPSFFEGVPLVLLEALASGCRIITTSLPGTKEVLMGVDKNFVRMIDLPALKTIDKPYSSDMPGLIQTLAGEIAGMLAATDASHNPVSDKVARIIRANTWEAVFSRIEKTYFSLLQ